VFKDCVFRNNRDGVLGAIDASVTLINCTFINNTCSYRDCVGGALGVGANNTNPINVTIINSSFHNNSVGLLGGAVYFYGSASSHATFTMINTTIADNTATSEESVAAGVGVVGAQVHVDSCRFIRNKCPVNTALKFPSGGGLVIFNSTSSTVTNSRMNFFES
jgi:hypothetical protein